MINNLSSAIPRPGMFATVRNRRGIVSAVEPFDGTEGRLHLVHLDYKDDQLPVEERLLWELEPRKALLEPTALPDALATDPMPVEDFDALLRAARWTAAMPFLDPDGGGPLDRLPISSPFHGAVQVEDFQLVPLLKALQMPRVNLLIADDVGLGKTVEAGLILSELLLRRRIQRVLILTPASLRLQWRDEMWDKFSLPFDLVDRAETHALHRRLGMDANPDDRVALRCWCGFENPSLNRRAWENIRRRAEDAGGSPWSVLEDLIAGNESLPYTTPAIARFRHLLRELRNLEGLSGTALVDALFPEDVAWALPIRAITVELEDEESPEGLLEILRRGITQPELPNNVDYVRVMSLHKSKGLTADLVVVASCIDGFIPTIEQGLTPREERLALEEQRRLFYVAITRTTQTLVLSSMTQLRRADVHRMGAIVQGGDFHHANTITSQFFRDLGPNRPRTVRGESILE